jgi:N-acetyl-alpha-D-glucosaminyl L-malate synthase BshA
MDRPLRIGIVCYPTYGGSGVLATELAQELARRGNDVHLISYARPARLRYPVPGLRYHEVQVTPYPLFRYPPYDLALATRMVEIREEAKIDIYHVHYAIPHAVSAFLAREMCDGELPFVTTLHGTDIMIVGIERAYSRATRFSLLQSDGVTAVSAFLARETQILFGLKQEIHVIPNFVDTQRFVPGTGPRWPDRPSQERVLVHLSNMRPVKRVGDVVRVFDKVRREIPARLVLAGDGPDRGHAETIARDLGCAGSIEWVGEVENAETLLANADLFLLTSETESFGLALLEAMSCGVPGVASDVGGVREVVGGTEAARLLPLGDVNGMARAAIQLLSDAALHDRARRAARARAETAFAMPDVVGRYEALYRSILAAYRPGCHRR